MIENESPELYRNRPISDEGISEGFPHVIKTAILFGMNLDMGMSL